MPSTILCFFLHHEKGHLPAKGYLFKSLRRVWKGILLWSVLKSDETRQHIEAPSMIFISPTFLYGEDEPHIRLVWFKFTEETNFKSIPSILKYISLKGVVWCLCSMCLAVCTCEHVNTEARSWCPVSTSTSFLLISFRQV